MDHLQAMAQELTTDKHAVSMKLSTSSERLVRPITERRSLRVFALAQRDVFLRIHGELNRFKSCPFV